MSERRTFLAAAASAVAGLGIVALLPGARAGGAPSKAERFPVSLPDAEWRKRLPASSYAVLRRASTEAPFTSELLAEKRRGVFACAGCRTPLYASATKFESGTGWPSFYQALPGSVGTHEDRGFMMVRTEVHCATCGGHLGHIFDDGPKPTGKRHCINGVALRFVPAKA